MQKDDDLKQYIKTRQGEFGLEYYSILPRVHVCNRCGKILDVGSTDWGNCTDCGDDLCMECAVNFDGEGNCKRCQEKNVMGHRLRKEFDGEDFRSGLCLTFALSLEEVLKRHKIPCALVYGFREPNTRVNHHEEDVTDLIFSHVVVSIEDETYDSEGDNAIERWEENFEEWDCEFEWDTEILKTDPDFTLPKSEVDPILVQRMEKALYGEEEQQKSA